MTIHKKLCPKGLGNNPNKNLTSISYITIHSTANYKSTATAKSHADWVYGGSMENGKPTKVSWHYTVDDKEIWQHFEDRQACWHAGDNSGDGNFRSIGIEICVNNRDGFRKACENAARLTADLLKKYGLGIERVVQHRHWSGKDCPSELRGNIWGTSWNDFIGMVKKYLGTAAAEEMYRVRKAWTDIAGQKGAFRVLANAKACADKYPGYRVYNSAGSVVY